MEAQPDSALLDRWVRSRDAVSFREITLRHAGMVYATCKRILGNRSDAEEVAQECFLALAKSSTTIQSLPGWLHTLAVRRSCNVARNEKRRRAREQQYAAEASQVESAGESDELWEMVKEHVDEAIAELPDELRDAIIGYFLQGRPQEDIARACGVSQATVSRRIERGAQLVRENLGRRGAVISLAALAALLESRMAEAAPAALLSALGKLALTSASSLPVAAAGAARLLGYKGVLALFGAVLIAGMGVVAYQRQSDSNMKGNIPPHQVIPGSVVHEAQQVNKETPAQSVAVNSPEVTPAAAAPASAVIKAPTQGATVVSGRVVDEARRPVAQASIFARSTPMSCAGGETDSEGRFRIEGLEATNQFCMIADRRTRDGDDCLATRIYGPVTLTSAGLVDLELVAFRTGTITGRLLDANRRPVPGAQLQLLPPELDTIYRCIKIKIDAAGHFTATGVPCEELGAYVQPASGSGIPMDSWLERIKLTPGQHLTGLNLIYTGKEALLLAGRVVNEAGEPIGRARIWDLGGQDTFSDENGAFSLHIEKEARNRIVVKHLEYEDGAIPAEDDGGMVKVVLHKANRARGIVLSADTRQAVPSYQMLVDGAPPLQWELINWDKAISVNDPEGRFDQACPAGNVATLLFRAEGFADTTVSTEAAGRAQEITVWMGAAHTLKGIVVDPAGQPVVDAKVFVDGMPMAGEIKTHHRSDARSGPDGSFELGRLAAGEHFVLVDRLEYGPTRQTVTVPASEPIIFTLTKGCTVTGSYSGLGPGARCMMVMQQDQLSYREIAEADGTFRLTGLPAGSVTITCEYNVLHGRWFDARKMEKTVVLEEGGTTTVDFDWPDAVVEGTVAFPSGHAGDLRIGAHLTGPDGTKLDVDVSGRPDGTFSIPSLYPGWVTLTASRFEQHAPVEELSAEVEAVAGETVMCNLAP